MLDATITPVPAAPTPDPRKLSDYWSLVLLLLAGLLVWQAFDAEPGDTADMFGMPQWLACSVCALLFITAFILIGRRNKKLGGRWFGNKSFGK